MQIYQLVATGFLVGNGSRVSRHSKRVFDDRRQAEAFKDAFAKSVTKPRSTDDVSYINPDSVAVLVASLDYAPKGMFDDLIDLSYWTALFSR